MTNLSYRHWKETVHYANKDYAELMAKLTAIVKKKWNAGKKTKGEPVGDTLAFLPLLGPAFFSKIQIF